VRLKVAEDSPVGHKGLRFGQSGGEREAHSPVRDVEAIQGILGARVLLVEDNAINQMVARELLEGFGLKVVVAGNGLEGLAALERDVFDLVLMDVQMPGIDGYETSRRIRKVEANNDLPVVALTAHAMAGDREKSLDAEMDDHLTKPIDPDELFDVLVKWINPVHRGGVLSQTKTTSAARLPAQLSGIDQQAGLRVVGGNHEIYLDLLRRFHRDNLEASVRLTGLLEHNRDEAKHVVHNIKGTAATIGAFKLSEAASGLELALRKGEADVESFRLQIKDSLSDVLSGLSGLESVEQEQQNTGGRLPDMQHTQSLVDELTAMLKEGDLQALIIAEQLADSLVETSVSEDIRALQEKISEFDFEQSLHILQRLVDGIEKAAKAD